MPKTLRVCLNNAGSVVGTVVLFASVALSLCAIPVLLALFWLS